jgi:predicted nuclease of predicted toxin-antitoxin system
MRMRCTSSTCHDDEIIAVSLCDRRVAATKDADFVNSFLLRREPYKLLLSSTRNIKDAELASLSMNDIEQIVEEFLKHDFIEVNQTSIIIHK